MKLSALLAKSWPFEQARALLKKVGGKECVNFETGYGASGTPTVATFAENVRTNMVRHAFEELTDHKILTRLIVFSDDYDGFRKVPKQLPESMEDDLGKPLTSVRDPFGKYSSFAERNNVIMRGFLDGLGIGYEFISATEYYKSGRFNDMMRRVLVNHDAIKDVMLPTLGAVRQATYSPILPISPITGNVLYEGFIGTDVDNDSVIFLCEDGKEHSISVLNGSSKSQWKIDWAMRWAALGIDYEMHGKDLIDSQVVSTKICKILGGKPPLTYSYELFLDDEGRKQSKSLGNGMTMEEWMRYSDTGPLAHFMFNSPRSAKVFSPAVVPRIADEYLKALAAYPKLEGAARLDSPAWHIHDGQPPTFTSDISYGLLLNLAKVSDAKDSKTLLNYLSQYKDISEADRSLVESLVPGVIAYVQEQVERAPTRAPIPFEARALGALADKLETLEDGLDGESYQYWVYEIGKEFRFDPLRLWFQVIYEVLFGDTQGPRFGSFIAAYGRQRSIELLRSVL